MKLSQWHMDENPVHVGVYKVDWEWNNTDYDGGVWFNYWNGTRFYVGAVTAIEAATKRGLLPKKMKFIRWRGVIK